MLINRDIKFTLWFPWEELKTIKDRELPGLYLLSHFDKTPINKNANPLSEEIIYIGETHKQTLNERLNKFERSAFKGSSGHSGGERYYKNFYGKNKKLYVSLLPINYKDVKLYVSLLPINYNEKVICSFIIKYIERKLLLEYAIKWKKPPRCNLD